MTSDPAQLHAKLQEGLACHQRGQMADAKRIYGDVLAGAPHYFDALLLAGVLAAQTGDFASAVDLMTRAVAVNPAHAGAHYNLATALSALKRYAVALASYDQALSIDPAHLGAHHNRSIVLRALGRADEALAASDRALALKPDYAEAHLHRGAALTDVKRFGEAVAAFDKAIALNAQAFEAHFGRGNALRPMGRLEAAFDSFTAAIRLRPDVASLYVSRGALLIDMNRWNEALADDDRALALNPGSVEAHNDRAVALAALGRGEEAVISYRNALRLRPDLADTHNNLGHVLMELKRHAEAIAAYDRVLELNPSHPFTRGMRLLACMSICRWDTYERDLADLGARVARGEKAAPPFPAVTLLAAADLQMKAIATWAASQYPANPALGPIAVRSRPTGSKIKLGYVSGDFRNHPLALLVAGLIEAHDRDRFEVYGFSFGPDTRDDLRLRLEKAFDRFFDVRGQSDMEIAALARANGIDIVIDLAGYIAGSRPNIFALRAAPLQVSYLGYPGSMGSDYFDYIVADEIVIPAHHRAFYPEKVVWLPGSYQVNDRKRVIAERAPERRAQGLPDNVFVFCSFNNTFKITPSVFSIWLDILGHVPGSVLWLFEDNPTAAANLRKEAVGRGIDASRICFAPRMGISDHLARHAHADLFLDTSPVNAHTTCSDALWAGLPVLTCIGEGFAGRVAASILKAMDMPELIAANVGDYRALAIALGNDPGRLAALKEKLIRNRDTASLFNVSGFARHIEDAYGQMFSRHRDGLPADHIAVRG